MGKIVGMGKKHAKAFTRNFGWTRYLTMNNESEAHEGPEPLFKCYGIPRTFI